MCRWLVHRGRLGEARQVLQTIASCNNNTIAEATLQTLAPPPPTQTSLGGAVRAMRGRLAVLCLLWFATALCYYGLHYATPRLAGSLATNFSLLAATEMVASVTAHLVLLPRCGRTPTLVTGLLLCSALLLASAAPPPAPPLAWLQLGLTVAGKFAATTNFNSVYFYTVEQVPLPLRSASLGLCSTAGRAGAVVAVAAAQLAWVSPHLPALVMAAPATLAALLLCKMPRQENKNCVLPDTE